jgi:hypothetical protein
MLRPANIIYIADQDREETYESIAGTRKHNARKQGRK